MMRILSALAVLLALLPAAARAQEDEAELPDLVQELFMAETAYPQDAGELQVTADVRYADAATGRLLAELGITDRLQVSAATPFVALEAGGEGEASLGVLYNLVNTPALAASVSLEVEVSTGRGEGEVVWEPALVVARQLGAAQAHLGVAAGFAREGTELSPGLGLLLDAGRITPALELTATLADGEPTELALTPGIFAHPSPHLEIGIGAPLELRHASLPDVMALVTFSF